MGAGPSCRPRPLVELCFQLWPLTEDQQTGTSLLRLPDPRAASLAPLWSPGSSAFTLGQKLILLRPPPLPKSPHRVWLAHISPTWLRVAAGSAGSRKWKRTTSLWDDWPINHRPFSINHGRWRGARRRLVGDGCSPCAWWEGWQKQGHFQLAGAAAVRCGGGGYHLMRFRPRRSACPTSPRRPPPGGSNAAA